MNSYRNILPNFIPTTKGKGWVFLLHQCLLTRMSEGNGLRVTKTLEQIVKNKLTYNNFLKVKLLESINWSKNIICYRFFILVILMLLEFCELLWVKKLFCHFFRILGGKQKSLAFLIPNSYRQLCLFCSFVWKVIVLKSMFPSTSWHYFITF